MSFFFSLVFVCCYTFHITKLIFHFCSIGSREKDLLISSYTLINKVWMDYIHRRNHNTIVCCFLIVMKNLWNTRYSEGFVDIDKLFMINIKGRSFITFYKGFVSHSLELPALEYVCVCVLLCICYLITFSDHCNLWLCKQFIVIIKFD